MFFRVFSHARKRMQICISKKIVLGSLFVIFRPSGIDFRQFWVSKRLPGGYFFGVFLKTSIFSKSCSRCGGSTVFKGQTIQKSVRRTTPNGTGKKKRQKSLPAPSPDALFRSRAKFLSILGSRPDPKMALKPAPAKKTCGF